MTNSWSSSDILEFLELYRTERILWDPKHNMRKDKKETLSAWERIECNISVTCSVAELKKKKESLMATYRDLKRKLLKNPEYHVSWFAFSDMDSFLGEFYAHGKSDGCNLNLDHDNNEDAQTDSSYFVSQNASNAYNTSSKKARKKKQLILASPYYKNKIYKTLTKRTKRESNSNIYAQEVYSDNDQLIRQNKQKKEPDEYDLYAQLLVKKLRKLDEHQRDVAMHEIDTIMFRAKVKTCNKIEPRSCSSSPIRKLSSPIFIVTRENQCDDESITYEEHVEQPSP